MLAVGTPEVLHHAAHQLRDLVERLRVAAAVLKVAMQDGKITDKISPSGRIERKTGDFGVAVETAKLSTAQLAREAQETMLLNDDQNETTVLNNPANETTVLQLEESKDGFTVDFEIGFIGTSEIIE